MAGKSKKHPVPNPVSLGTGVKAPMVSLKVKKQKKRSRGKWHAARPPVDEKRVTVPMHSW